MNITLATNGNNFLDTPLETPCKDLDKKNVPIIEKTTTITPPKSSHNICKTMVSITKIHYKYC